MPLSINARMRHLRKPPISMRVNGSRQKRDLRNIGYYHGYKGYRFIHRSNERIALDDFDQLKRIYDFDMSLKTLIYPQIMFVETTLKNRVLEATLEDAKSEVFEVIFTTSMTAYREKQGKQYREALQKRFRARDEINAIIYSNCKNSGDPVIWHFLEQGRRVPIWAIFEELTLGQFGNFYLTLKSSIKQSVADGLSFPKACEGGKILGSIIFTLKDLRNAVAHNKPVFDLRFKTEAPGKPLERCMEIGTGVDGITFGTITDYIILIAYMMRSLGSSKTDCKRFLNAYLHLIESGWISLPDNLAVRIAGSDVRRKISRMTVSL